MKEFEKKLMVIKLVLIGIVVFGVFILIFEKTKAATDDIDADVITNCSYSYDGTNMRITYNTRSTSDDPKPKNDSQQVNGGADTLITGKLVVDGVQYGPTTVGRFCENGDIWSQKPGDTIYNIGLVSAGTHSATFSVTFGDLRNCGSDLPTYTKVSSCQPVTFDKDGVLNLPCNASCSGDDRCSSGYCYNGQCRNFECPDSNTCICPAKCDEPCNMFSTPCDSGLTCVNSSNFTPVSNWQPVGICRNLSCPADNTCKCTGTGGDCNENPGNDEVSACARCDASNNPYVEIYWNSGWKKYLDRISPDNYRLLSSWVLGYLPSSDKTTDTNSIQNGQSYQYQLSGWWGTTIKSNVVVPNCVAVGECGPAATASPYAWDAGGWAGSLCSGGMAIPSSIAFPSAGSSMSWICKGTASNTPCSATVNPKPDAGECGGADKHEFEYNVSPESYTGIYNQCDLGIPTYTGFPAQGSSVTWFCNNQGVLSPQCRATRAKPPIATYTCPACGTKDIQINIKVPDIDCPGCP